MPPPFFQPSQQLTTKVRVPARICLRRGFTKIDLPPGRYLILEIHRNDELWHDQEQSDGYTYRIMATKRENQNYGKRISIWQNDLVEAVYGGEQD